MVLKGAEVHKCISIQHCHNFLYMMHLWKIVLQHEMQELVLDLDFILSLNEMFGMNHIEC